MSDHRHLELLRVAAEALEDGRDPFEHSFLAEHEVTLDECFDLSDNLALGARMLIASYHDLASGSELVRKVAAAQVVRAAIGRVGGAP